MVHSSGEPDRGRIISRNQSGKANSVYNNNRTKFCRLCHLAGSDHGIYTNHEIGQCSRLSIKDMDSMKSALSLNYGELTNDESLEAPQCVYQPGWDDGEIAAAEDETDATAKVIVILFLSSIHH